MNSSKARVIMDTTFRVWGNLLNPQEITDVLQTTPTSSQTKGKTLYSKSGKIRNAKLGLWTLKLDDSNDERMEEQLNSLLKIIKQSSKRLDECDGFEGAVITMLLGVEEGADSIEFRLAPTLLNELGNLNIEIAITVL